MVQTYAYWIIKEHGGTHERTSSIQSLFLMKATISTRVFVFNDLVQYIYVGVLTHLVI